MESNEKHDETGWSDEEMAAAMSGINTGEGINQQNEGNSEMEENDKDEFIAEQLYNPAEFANLPVGPEIREIFQLISKYSPQVVEIEPKLRPFIPDYIPAVGDIDPFLKVDRPDGQRELLGLSVIDEPSLHQSEPSILDLKLRTLYKQSSAKITAAKTIDDFAKNPKLIDKWIKDIGELHQAKPSANFNYTRPMPDIDTLLQEWPAEIEETLKETGIPPPDLECSLSDYISILCGETCI